MNQDVYWVKKGDAPPAARFFTSRPSGANCTSAHALLTEYHDIFSLEPGELGCTSLAMHEIRVVDDEPFKERF